MIRKSDHYRNGDEERIGLDFERLIDQWADGVIVVDEAGSILTFNRGAERLFGYQAAEVLGQSLDLLLPERLRQVHREHVRGFTSDPAEAARMASGRIVQALAKDGSEFPIDATISKIRSGEEWLLSVVLRDASSREASMEASRVREEHARALADAIPALISFVDSHQRYVFVNQTYVEWSGQPRDAFEGHTLQDAVGEEIYARAGEHVAAALRGLPGRYRNRVRRGDGSVRDLDVFLSPVTSDSGVEGFYVAAFDVTEPLRNAAAEETILRTSVVLPDLLDSDVLLESVVHLVSTSYADDCSVFMAEEDGAVVRVSREDRRQVASEFDVPESVRATLADGQTRALLELPSRRAHVSTLIKNDREPRGVILFSWDPPFDPTDTDLVMAEDVSTGLALALDRIDLYRETRQAVRARDWLLERVAHDLGGPVASAAMVLDRILRNAPRPDRRTRSRELLERLLEETKQMQILIEDLLDTSELRTGMFPVHALPTDATQAVLDAVSRFEQVAASRGIEIVSHVPEPSPWTVADPRRLRHLLSALVGHALAAADRGDTLRLSVGREDRAVLFSLTGPGQPPPVDRLSGPPPSLNLEIAREIAKAHGTDVSATQAEGGCNFSFALPLASH